MSAQYKFGDVVYVKGVVVDEPRASTSNKVSVALAEGTDRSYFSTENIVRLAQVVNTPPMNPEPRDNYGLPMVRVRTRTGVETWLSLRDLVRIVEDEGLIER